MPLDSRHQDLPRLCSLSGAAGFVIEKGRLRTVTGADKSARARAKSAFAIWQALNVFDDAGFVILRGPERFALVQRAGGAIVEAKAPMNVGLLRKTLADSKIIDVEPDFTVTLEEFATANQVAWALAARVDRVEAVRRFEIMVGEDEYVLQADAGGFGIIDQEGGAERLRSKVSEAVSAEEPVEFTFGQPKDVSPSSRHTTTEILAPLAEAETAEFLKNGWPVKVPADLGFERLQALVAVVQIMANDALREIDLRRIDGSRMIQIKSDGTGERFAADLG